MTWKFSVNYIFLWIVVAHESSLQGKKVEKFLISKYSPQKVFQS